VWNFCQFSTVLSKTSCAALLQIDLAELTPGQNLVRKPKEAFLIWSTTSGEIRDFFLKKQLFASLLHEFFIRIVQAG
jgi:hypothetical protein